MIQLLEHVTDNMYRGFFVDLCAFFPVLVARRHADQRVLCRYVRCTNNVAIVMYEGMGYSVYRRVREYYGSLGQGKGRRDDEDAFGTSSHSATALPKLRIPVRYAQTNITRRQSPLRA